MKTSKRSLITAIAVLCVCALSLSAASFAWFSAAKNATVESVSMKVQAQSDIKISANPAVIDNAEHPDWVTIVTEKMIKDNQNTLKDYIADATPKTAGVCDGNFQQPEFRDKVDSITGEYADTALVDGKDNVSEFTIYIRTTKNTENVSFTWTDFVCTQASTGANAVDGLRLGVKVNDSVANGYILDEESTQICVAKEHLKSITGSECYYAAVTFYMWVEGTDFANCNNTKALALKEYTTNMTFSYSA